MQNYVVMNHVIKRLNQGPVEKKYLQLALILNPKKPKNDKVILIFEQCNSTIEKKYIQNMQK